MLRQIIVFTKSPELTTIKGIRDSASFINGEIMTLNPHEEMTWCSKDGFRGILSMIIEKKPLIIIRTSGVEFDDSDLVLAQEMERLGATLATPITSQNILRNKDAQTIWMGVNNVVHIETLIHRGPLTREDLEAWCPSDNYVLKPTRGNKGIGVTKFSQDELIEHWEQLRKKGDLRYLIQPFIKTREFRHLVLGEEHFFIEKIPSPDTPNEWKRNSEYSIFTEIDEDRLPKGVTKKILIERATFIQERLGLANLALDLLEQDDDLKVLEINGQPGLDSASEALRKNHPEINLYELYLKAISNKTSAKV